MLLPACSPKITEKIRTEIQYRDRLVPVAVSVEIPYFVERNVTKDTTSHLENPYAKSDAYISGGFLYHTLETKPQSIPDTAYVHVTDTLYKEAETIVKTEYVEKKLSWWQKAKINSFWYLIIGLAAALVWIFRKPIISLIKTIL